MSEDRALPCGWAECSLDEVVEFVRGISFPSAAKATGPGEGLLPCLRTTNVQQVTEWDDVWYVPESYVKRPDQYLQVDDILMSVSNSLALVGKVSPVISFPIGPSTFGTFILAIRPREDGTARFLYYALASPVVQANIRTAASTTTNISNVSVGKLKPQAIRIPPLNEQRRIADKLDELLSQLDAGVAALERVQANLKRYRAAVLKAAVEGKLTAQWRAEHPEVEPASVLLERILADRRRHWEAEQLAKFEAQGKRPPKGWQAKYKEPEPPDTTDLPELPEGWCWASVEQVIRDSLTNGISRKGTPTPPGVAVLRLSAMSEEGFDYADRQYIDIDANAAERLRICRGDFFISRGNGALRLVGRGTLAQDPEEPIVFPDLMIRVRFCGSPVLRSYVSRVWPSIHLRRQIETAAKTTAGIYKINQQDIARLVLPLPPEAEQHELTAAIESRFSIADHVAEQVAQDASRAARLRQSILKQAFEGKLVPQDPNDEPAEVLLERIAAERGQARPKAPWRGRMG